jgi:signal peptidase I
MSVKGELLREALGWAKAIIGALVLAWVFTNFVIVNAQVPTGSMKNTINEGDRIIAWRPSYMFSEPERYDIVVFRGHGEDTTLYVKRIIGVPGDTLYIENGLVYVNGEEEPLRNDFVLGTHSDNFPYPTRYPPNDYVTLSEDGFPLYITVPEGHYFVLGDNRGNSVDSRSWGSEGTLRTFVADEQIQGRVLFRYWPGIQNLTK